MSSPKKVVILGGGVASLITAYELTRTPELRRRHTLTVYQHGHRLGGKCASSINPEQAQRIEEHGLHILFGFYENVFRVLRECYAELGRPAGSPLATWKEAVFPQHLVVMPELAGGRHEFWPLYCPANDEVPGDGAAVDDPWRYLLRLADWIHFLVKQWGTVRPDEYPTDWPEPLREESTPLQEGALRVLIRRLVQPRTQGRSSGLMLAELARRLLESMARQRTQRPEDIGSLGVLLQRSLEWMWSRAGLSAEARRTRMLLDLLLTVARGLVADGLLSSPPRWFSIDGEDSQAWLLRHGAHPETARGPLVQSLLMATFHTHEPMGAGTFVHMLLRLMCSYKGAPLYRLRAGMGETLIAPLYEVLQRRGVRFEFFHSVRGLELSADRHRVARVALERQATVREGTYQPLVDVDGLPCWPSRPRYEQLVEGEALRAGGHDLENWWDGWPGVGAVTLEEGRDFDTVVLGMSLGVLPETCRELVNDPDNPRFRQMVERVRTTATQAAQLWMTKDLTGLGWNGSRGPQPPLVLPYAPPFEAWSDMTYLLSRERWPVKDAPRHLAYLCSTQPDEEPVPPRGEGQGYVERQRRRLRTSLTGWLHQHATRMWPGTARPEGQGFDWRCLVDPQGRTGEERLGAQFWCTPPHPSDRYVLSVPGSSAWRLRADESGYDNLLLAGDWTLTALSLGCLEAAALSGFAAARALEPSCRRAAGDWLPERPRPTPVARERLPAYRSTGPLSVATPPYWMRNQLSMHLLQAGLPQLQALCDRFLNLPGAPVTYRPLGPHVVLYCSAQELGPLEDPVGWTPENDVGIWLPVVARGPDEEERYLLFTPYLWVDLGLALATGREYYGYPKELARLRMPEHPEQAEECTLDTLVLPRFGPSVRMEERRLLTVRPPQDMGARLRALVSGGGQLLSDAEPWLLPGVPSDYMGLVRGALRERFLRMVFLKQFPDVTQPTRACYQALVEAPIHVTTPLRGGLLPSYEVDIHAYDSHPLVDALGLRPMSRSATVATVLSSLSMWLQFEARVELGAVVYERLPQRG